MISIYLDWSVIAQMKNNLHPELREALTPSRFLMPYSTSHIGDILASFKEDATQRDLIKEDLNLLAELSGNNCLFNTSKEIKLDYMNPPDLFEEPLSEQDLLKNFSLDTLNQLLQSDEATKAMGKQMVDSIRNMPVDKTLLDALNNPESAQHLEALFPGLRDNPTMDGVFQSLARMFAKLNDDDHYKTLRRITQSGLGINRDQMFNAKDPYAAIEKTYENLNFDPNKFVQQNNYAPAWFDEISNAYLKLDMHGFQEDKVNTAKGRKETFRNTTEDSFHAAFASTCHYFIVNDNRAYEKTRKVFEKLKLDTYVFKPNEFLEHYNNFLAARALDVEIKIPGSYLSATPLAEEKTEDGFSRTYHLPYFVFDFFNKMFVTSDQHGRITMILLTRFTPTNKKITYFFDIERQTPPTDEGKPQS